MERIRHAASTTALSSPRILVSAGLAQSERHFTFHYAFTVKNISRGERVRVWIPVAHSDAYQEVKVTSKSGDLPLKRIRQPEYGNEVLYAEASKADKNEYRFAVDYDVVRKEHVVLVNGKPVGLAVEGASGRVGAVSGSGPVGADHRDSCTTGSTGNKGRDNAPRKVKRHIRIRFSHNEV